MSGKALKPQKLCKFFNKNGISFQRTPSIIFETNLDIARLSNFGSVSRKNARVRKEASLVLYPLTVINLIKIASTLYSSGTSRFEFVTRLFDFLDILNLGSAGHQVDVSYVKNDYHLQVESFVDGDG